MKRKKNEKKKKSNPVAFALGNFTSKLIDVIF